MTTYTALELWALDIPTTVKLVWFDGIDKQARYAALIDRYPTCYNAPKLCACAMHPNDYARYKREEELAD